MQMAERQNGLQLLGADALNATATLPPPLDAVQRAMPDGWQVDNQHQVQNA
jgi:hypothetical protein